MKLSDVVEVSSAVGRTSSRLQKTALLAEVLGRMDEREIDIGVAYLSGSLVQGRVGIGWSAIGQARESGVADVPSLDLRDVDEIFERIARTSGAGAAGARSRLLAGLFTRATRDEQDFLMRLLSGDLRQGALEGVLMEAVAKAAGIPVDAIRQAAMMAGDLNEIARVALTEGGAALSRYTIQLFRPVQPMLASPADTAGDALEMLGAAAFEFKLDGARIQVHKAGDEVRVYSRGLRDVSAAVPEVVEAARMLAVREVILDGEVLAIRPDGTPLPFQETMRRFGRRLEVEAMRTVLPLTPFFFDCLYRDGQPLAHEPQQSRFSVLMEIASHLTVPHRIIDERDAAEDFLKEALRAGHEGLMAKALDAPYAAGSRGRAWLKIKLARSLDLVVLAAEWGNGRRRGWLSNLHLGARDPEGRGFIMLGKTFKGLTDEMLEWQTKAFLQREVSRDAYTVFLRPELVVEVAFNDIQESPQYPGGLALRFARVKGYRPDKSPAEADTLATVQEIYHAMTGRTPPPPRIRPAY